MLFCNYHPEDLERKTGAERYFIALYGSLLIIPQKLKDKQANAIKAIDQKIEKMKEAMSGALSKLGKLLLLAAKKFFTWALEKFGYSLSEIESIINKGAVSPQKTSDRSKVEISNFKPVKHDHVRDS